MLKPETINVLIGHPVPNAGKIETGMVISVWEEANRFLKNVEFRVEGKESTDLVTFIVSLDADELVFKLRDIRQNSGDFASYLELLGSGEVEATEARLGISISPANPESETGDIESCIVAGIFLHQLMLAMNIAFPGSCQLLKAHYEGKNRTDFLVPEFTADFFGNAWMSAVEADWPKLKEMNFTGVWEWLARQGTSQTDTAIMPINKVLFGLLSLSQNSPGPDGSQALVVAHMLELIVGIPDGGDVALLRERVSAVLGISGEKAGSYNELYRQKVHFVKGELPVIRPLLHCKLPCNAMKHQLEGHESPVEQATAIIIALIQDLVEHNSSGYRFVEQFIREQTAETGNLSD